MFLVGHGMFESLNVVVELKQYTQFLKETLLSLSKSVHAACPNSGVTN